MKEYLRFGLGAMSLIAPGFSVTVGESSLKRFSFSIGGGETDCRFRLIVAAGMAVPGAEVDDGFLSPRREGGGGASSASPWLRNCELNVFTVFGRFSVSLRTSMEMEAFLAAMASLDFVSPVDSVVSAEDIALAFFGILPNLLIDGGITLDRVSLSLSACDTFGSLDDLTSPLLRSLSRLLDELDLLRLLLLDDDDFALSLSLRSRSRRSFSLSLLRSLSLSLLRSLSLLLLLLRSLSLLSRRLLLDLLELELL